MLCKPQTSIPPNVQEKSSALKASRRNRMPTFSHKNKSSYSLQPHISYLSSILSYEIFKNTDWKPLSWEKKQSSEAYSNVTQMLEILKVYLKLLLLMC